jgi:NADH-quinone oxidoreductase subunit J
MTAQQFFFIIFAAATLLTALRVVTAGNLFHAALWLVLTLASVAALFALLEAGFLTVIQVLLYIGAIAVLIIFAVMLTRDVVAPGRRLNAWSGVGAAVAVALFVVLAQIVGTFPWTTPGAALPEAPADYITVLGKSLVDSNQFLLPFEVISVLLLVALIGSVYVARERQKNE